MKFKILFITTVLLIAMSLGCVAQEKEIIEEVNPVGNKKSTKNQKVKDKDNLKILAKGSYSKVETPFIYVAKDIPSLNNLLEFSGIDALKDDFDLEKNVVLAAFAGTRRTGGYSVAIEESEKSILIKLNTPPKGMMVTQALTQPFQIILLPIEKFRSVKIETTGNWKNKAQKYQVKSGIFQFSGGIAGINKSFEPKGTIEVFQLNELVTLILDLYGTGKDQDRKLYQVFSTDLKGEKILPVEINGGNFITPPHPVMKFSGFFNDEKFKFELVSEDKDYRISDAFQGRGNFEALTSQ